MSYLQDMAGDDNWQQAVELERQFAERIEQQSAVMVDLAKACTCQSHPRIGFFGDQLICCHCGRPIPPR